jgi:hypothetical protein
VSRVGWHAAMRAFFLTLCVGNTWFALVCAISGAPSALLFLLSAVGSAALAGRQSARIRQLRISEFTAMLTFAASLETGERLAMECERADPEADGQSRTWGLYARIR